MSRDFHNVRVASRTKAAKGVVRLLLEPVDKPLPEWSAGAHVDVVLPSGLVRQYSLCGPLDASNYAIAVLLECDGRGGSREVHEHLEPGTELRIHGPRNHFPLEEAEEYLFIAGGIGITPFLPMIEIASNQGIPWRMVYGGRCRATMAFVDELTVFDSIRIVPEDEAGLINVRDELMASPNALVYVCGPTPLIDAVQRALEDLGRPAAHFERFVALGSSADSTSSRAFEVQLGRGGRVIQVGAGQTILAAVLDAGVDVLFSCEEGTCGSCQVHVLEGDVDHRDQLLTDSERAAGDMLICVSRANCARLVLEIDEDTQP